MTTRPRRRGLTQSTVEKLGGQTYEVTADLNSLSPTKQTAVTNAVANAMAKAAGVGAQPGLDVQRRVRPGAGQITKRAVEALIVFFIAVVLYISVRFEPKMALAAFIAMVHDLLVTVGVFSLFGFQITPDTVIALLTILGYSLYDTVVVFDRVRDNAGDGPQERRPDLRGDGQPLDEPDPGALDQHVAGRDPAGAVGADRRRRTSWARRRCRTTAWRCASACSRVRTRRSSSRARCSSMFKEREPRFRELAARVALARRPPRRSRRPPRRCSTSGGPAAHPARRRAPARVSRAPVARRSKRKPRKQKRR